MNNNTARKTIWLLASYLLLFILAVGPVMASHSLQEPLPPEAEEPEELFDHFGTDNVDPVFRPIDEPAAQLFTAPQSFSPFTGADLPSFYDEGLGQFDAANAIEYTRYLVEEIGPRLTGTPQEMEAALHFGSLLESFGYQVTIETYPQTVTRNVGMVTSPSTLLPGSRRWQLTSSTSGKITTDDNPVIAEVVYAGSGQTPADFPPDTSGKIVMMNYSTTASIRNTAVVNAVSRGAAAVILAQTTVNSAPISFTLSTPQPNTPILGAGDPHRQWILSLLQEGPLTLTITTNRYINLPLVNVVGVRRAVNDPSGASAPIVMVGGHIDTVLGAPGASDNASGSAASIEIARILSQYALDKEIRIAGWGAEESGLVGATRYVASLNAAIRARFVGYWNMDMVASPHATLRLWALTPNGQTNHVVQTAQWAASYSGVAPFDFCRLGSSDHVPFYNAGIPAALFIYINYTKPANCATTTGGYSLEAFYHRPNDVMTNTSQSRMDTALKVVGGSAFYSALNKVTLSAAGSTGDPVVSATVRADCGDGWRNLGSTNTSGALQTAIPHATCDFKATYANGLSTVMLNDVDIHGDLSLVFPTQPPILGPVGTVLLNGSTTGYPTVVSSASPIVQSSCEPLNTASVGAKSVTCTATDSGGNSTTAVVGYNVLYDFVGFTNPVINLPELNLANSGQAIPLKWQLLDANGDPVTGLAGVSVTAANLVCPVGVSEDEVEEYAAGKSGLQNLGEGYYQFNWSTPKSYARSCKTMLLNLGEGKGFERTAIFQFTR